MRRTIFTVASLIAAQQSSALSLEMREEEVTVEAFEAQFGNSDKYSTHATVDDDCCEFFAQRNYRAKSTNEERGSHPQTIKETVCHDGSTSTTLDRKDAWWGIQSYRCGKNTWMDMTMGEEVAKVNYTVDCTARNLANSISYCESQGARIASIHSQEDNDTIQKMIQNSDCPYDVAYIGAYAQTQDNWSWNDGSSWDFTNYGDVAARATPEPVLFMHKAGLWYDGVPEWQLGVACQKTNEEEEHVDEETVSYYVDCTQRSYADSVDFCISQEREIATIHSKKDNDAIKSLQNSSGCSYSYIGAYRQDALSAWEWDDHSAWNYENAGKDELAGNEDRHESRIVVNKKGEWKDWWTGDVKHGVVCQKKKQSVNPKDLTKYPISAAGRIDNPRTLFFNPTIGPYSRDLPAVTIFVNDDCEGASASVYANPDPAEDGAAFFNEQLSQQSLFRYPYDTMHSSVMVPGGYTLKTFSQDQFLGEEEEIVGSYVTNRAEFGELTCHQLKNQNHGIRSLTIKKAKYGKATGFWQGITATEALSYEIHVGIVSEKSDTTAQSSAQTLQTSLQSGFSSSVTATATLGNADIAQVSVSGTKGKSGSKSSSSEQQSQASREVSTLASQSNSQTYSTTCTPALNDSEAGAGLWQWVIATEDLSVTALTNHTVCRTGDAARTAPNCTVWDCANADCTLCKGDEE